MVKNLVKKIMETALIGTILFGNHFISYAPTYELNTKDFTAVTNINYRKLGDIKNSRRIFPNKKQRNVKKTYKEIVSYAGEVDTLYIPEYRFWEVPSNMCARYSRLSSEDVFGLKYNYDKEVLPKKRGAWNLKYYNKVVKISDKGFSKEELEKLAEERTLQPGMMILLHNPKSRYRNWKDKTGKKVTVTHSTIYIGDNVSNGNLRVMNQLISSSKPLDLDYLLNKGWIVKEILDIPD